MTAGTTTRSTPDVSIHRVERIDFRMVPYAWPFAQQRRGEIEAFFSGMKREKPSLWNGRVLMFRNCRLADGELRGEGFETDYASFLAWHGWDWPDRDVSNCFALPAIEGSDGGFLLGKMGAHTANAGHIYFPCGTPDPNDVAGSRVDFDLSVQRELLEETGIGTDAFDASPGWTVTLSGRLVALFKPMRGREPAAVLRERMMKFLGSQKQPELSDIVIVRSAADIVPAMPAYLASFLTDALSSRIKT